MKKSLILIPALALAFGLNSCKKDTADTTADGSVISVSSTYKAAVFEVSATWCGPCGQYGYPAMHDIMHTYEHHVTGIFLHDDDDIISPVPAEQTVIVTKIGTTGIPSSSVNLGADTYPTYLEPQVQAAINANTVAKAGVGIGFTKEGVSLKVNTKTVFFDNVTGTYNLAVYVVENGVMNSQNGQSAATVEHNNVFQCAAGGQAWGTTIATNPTKGTKIDGSYTITIPSTVRNRDNVHVVAVIYKMENGAPVGVLNSNVY